MEGGFCNIQVLLRAAEFLERRERGQYFMASAFSKGKKLVIVKTTKCTANGVLEKSWNQVCKWMNCCLVWVFCGRSILFVFAERLFFKICFLPLTQWPTYRSYHCTQWRQSGPVWKWIGRAGAFTRNESEADKSSRFEIRRALCTLCHLHLKFMSKRRQKGISIGVSLLRMMAPKTQKTTSSWLWRRPQPRFVLLPLWRKIPLSCNYKQTMFLQFLSPFI